MNSTRDLPLLLLLPLLFLHACGVPFDDLTAAQRQGLIGGIDDDGDGAAVLIRIQTADGMEGVCSGVVIGPRTVLSAAHCVAPQSVGRDATFSVFLGTDFRDVKARSTPGTALAVERTEFDPAFIADLLNRGHDIGVLFTSAPIEVPPVALARDPLPGQASDLRMVGYGLASATDIDGTTVGRRREAHVPVLAVRGRFIDVGTASLGPCLGDSGGPAFFQQDASSAERLVGLVSYSTQACDGGAQLTAISAYLPLIDGWLASADRPQPDPPPGCTMTGSRKSGGAWMGLLLVILLGFVRRFRRRTLVPIVVARSPTASESSLSAPKSCLSPPAS